jgi:hypothetical protein
MTAVPLTDTSAVPAHGVSFGEGLRVWLRIAELSFGGPAGQIAVMHRIIVRRSAAPLLHAFLGTRRRREAGAGPQSGVVAHCDR